MAAIRVLGQNLLGLRRQRVDIALSDGRRILVEGPTTLSAVMAMVAGLAQ